jgi:hypothetical protein
MQLDSPDSKPRAKGTISTLSTAEGNAQHALAPSDAARRLFDNSNLSPQTQTEVEGIAPSVLDNLLYEAQKYDSIHVASLGNPTAAVSIGDSNMHINQDNQETQLNLNGLPGQKAQSLRQPFSAAG